MSSSFSLQTSNEGLTPLSFAISQGSTAVVSFLQHWTLSVLPRRAVLASVNLARRIEPPPPPVAELLRHLAAAPDDIVRVILEFV